MELTWVGGAKESRDARAKSAKGTEAPYWGSGFGIEGCQAQENNKHEAPPNP